jgi:O-antigen ligase
MDQAKQAMIIAEYNTLRAELIENTKYVFGRPLLIVTAIGIAFVQVSNKSSVIWFSFLLTFVLLINLWFTINRLRSIALIAAYIAVVLESCPEKWIGWECSLRKYRMWKNLHNRQDAEKIISEHIDVAAISQGINFYYPLFIFHVVAVAVALAISIYTIIEENSLFCLLAFLANLITACIFAACCVGPYRPSKMRSVIERRHIIWIEALGIAPNKNTSMGKIG